MSRDEGEARAADAARAGFWRRLVAVAIDVLLINVFVVVIGLALTGLTGSAIRIAGSTIVDAVDCTATGPVSLRDPFPAITLRCTRSVLGVAHDWTLEKMTKGADDGYSLHVETPLDAQGQPVRAFYIDDLIPLLLAAYFLLFEWGFGTTPGKRITAVGVRSLGGGSMNIVQAGKRTLTRLVVLVCAGVFDLYSGSTTHIQPPSSAEAHQFMAGLTLSPRTADLGAVTQVLKLVVLAYFVSFVVKTVRRQLPLHDWWAGTEAVRWPFRKKAADAPISI